MSREVVIMDSALVCAAGNLDQCWQELMAGGSALTALRMEGLNCQVGRIAALGNELGTGRRLATLLDLGLSHFRGAWCRDRLHLVVATTKGAADEPLSDFRIPGRGFAWQVAEMIAHRLDAVLPCSTVSAACASGTVALIQASQMIAADQADQVLVVGVDILSRFVLAGFSQLQALAHGPCRPFDKTRDGLCLGEGIGLMLLAAQETVPRHRRADRATIRGWGLACDAGHITAPCRRASGLTAALRQATRNGAEAVGAINAHGTGTLYNDTMEIRALRNMWGEMPPPLHGVKGAMGHCLGAAGVMEACLAVKALEAGQIPPTVGLRIAEAFPGHLSNRPQQLLSPTLLTCNSGFGGINAALMLGMN
ncbi:MAG: beta-ketoacyl synthase [Desulfobulbaceae bacterium]|nr:MAG: beta-ketoacyl synthase [Desulfobulbaceae bacterium]